MSRHRKVAETEAVMAAMAAFWQHGFGNLGTRQIEAETGITRFTLQQSYGGKMPLFLKVLDTYLDLFEEHVSPDMTDGDLETIAAWFETRVTPEVLPDLACFGCLMLNTLVEFSASDAEVSKRADRFFDMLRGGFVRALSTAKDQQNLSDDFDVDAMAEVLVAASCAMNVVIRAGGTNDAGKLMATATAQLVRSWA